VDKFDFLTDAVTPTAGGNLQGCGVPKGQGVNLAWMASCRIVLAGLSEDLSKSSIGPRSKSAENRPARRLVIEVTIQL